MKSQSFSIKKRLKSFIYAANGLKTAIAEEHNARIHVVAAITALACSALLRISSLEWCAVIFAIGFVFAMELFNSAIENIADFISPKKHETIKKVKDMSAAAVLASAVAAFAVGMIVFVPKIINLVF